MFRLRLLDVPELGYRSFIFLTWRNRFFGVIFWVYAVIAEVSCCILTSARMWLFMATGTIMIFVFARNSMYISMLFD